MARIAVLGAGGTGSAAARFLAREGHSVVVLEQFELDHDRGSSYGSSRIIRRVYADRLYTALMNDAYPLWEELERDAGADLKIRTGGLFLIPQGHPELEIVEEALQTNGVPYDRMTAAETLARFPAFRLPPDEVGIYEADAGLLRASDCVNANLRLAAQYGATIRTQASVERIDTGSDDVTLHLRNGEQVSVDLLIVAAGPWMRPLLSPFVDLPLAVTRQAYCHFTPDGPMSAFEVGAFPIWIDFATLFYGFPHQPEIPGVKVAWHAQGQAADPESVDREVRDADREALRRYCSDRFPGLSPQTVYEKVCLYTNTPDEDFIIDTLPGDPRVVYVSGCSGHGFKFTVLLGRIAAMMATETPLPWDLSRFRAARFPRPAESV